MQALAGDFLGKSPLYLNAARLDTVGEGDARNRFARACQELVSYSFPSLRMLKGAYDETTLSKALVDPNESLAPDVEPTEAEQEVLTYVIRNQNDGERTSVEQLVANFGRRPYGWYPMAVLTLVGRLFRMGKVELRNTDLLDARTALEHLKNSRQHGSTRVRLQEQFDASKVNALKRFHQVFFDRGNTGTEARSVGQMTSDALSAEARDLTVLLDQKARYAFLAPLGAICERITKLGEKDYTYLLAHLAEFQDDLLTAKEDLLSPVKAFMHGAQRSAYDEAVAFLREEEANFAELPAAEVQPLRDLAAIPHPYRGNAVPLAKAAVVKLRGLLAGVLKSEREQALTAVAAQEARLRATDEWKLLDENGEAQVLAPSLAARTAVQSARFVTGIRDRIQRYNTYDYPQQLALAAKLAAAAKTENRGDNSAVSVSPPVSYTAASSLRPECKLTYVATQGDLDQWLAALRAAAQAELNKGNRIVL
jgi:hypothetical protein